MASDNISLIQKIPTTYFDLIQKVGSKGKYQKISFIIFLLLWLITSLLIMGTSFLFLNPKLNCDSIGISDNKKCEDYVCSLPKQEISKFQQHQNVASLATDFGPFHCDKLYELSALRTTLFVGVSFGYMFVFYFTDNFGRKFSMVAAWSIAVLGIGILSAAFNIQLACLGLFLAGLGSQTTIRITMTFISQVVQNSLRQKYSIFLQIAFGVGSILIGLAYMLIGNWRIIMIVFCLVPSIVLLLFVIFFVEETPKFLIQKDKQKALKSLNRIAKINNSNHIVTLNDIQNVFNNDFKTQKKRTPLDLCRYKSIRSSFIACSVFLFCINMLYLGPAIIISELPLNIFASQIILGATQAISYPVCAFFIEKLPRKKSGYCLIGVPLIIFLILIFVKLDQNCKSCFTSIISIILVFLARFCICAYFSVFFLFITEVFPLPLRGIGFGTASLLGSIGNISSQFIFSSLSSTNLNPMVLFALFSAIACVSIYFLPETLNKKLQEKIEDQNNRISVIQSDLTKEDQDENELNRAK